MRGHTRGSARRIRAGRLAAAWAAGTIATAVAAAAPATPVSLTLDPARTRVRFEVDSTLHRVHGTLRVVSGEVRFDTEGGAASGRIELDARSAETGNGMRDDVLHEDVLESARFPRAVFLPEHVELLRRDGAEAEVRIGGRIEIHGEEHPLVIDARVRADGSRAAVSGGFRLPYVAWGMRDPGNFLLSVDDVVEVAFDAEGRLEPPLP